MKKLLKIVFIILPNLPLILGMYIYVIYNLFKETGFVELSMVDNWLTEDIKKYVLEFFPAWFFNTTALIFWLSVFNSKIIHFLY